MRPSAASVCGLKLLVHAALSYSRMQVDTAEAQRKSLQAEHDSERAAMVQQQPEVLQRMLTYADEC